MRTLFKEDLPRKIPAKFGPNWPSGLGGEDVKKIVDDRRWTQLPLSMFCSGKLKSQCLGPLRMGLTRGETIWRVTCMDVFADFLSDFEH